MAQILVRDDGIELDKPMLVEGLPGIGLVGKIATDHLVETLDMTYYAAVECTGLPRLAVYEEGERGVLPPVRLYADEETNLLALQSDVPISAEAASEFAACVTGWLESEGVTPIFLSGLPAETEDVPTLSGVAVGDATTWLDDADIPTPEERGAISGPTGALLARASETGLTSVGLIVESHPQFPDPAAARRLIEGGIEPIADIDIGVETLVEQAEQIRTQREQLAQRMEEATQEESTQAQPLRMFQ